MIFYKRFAICPNLRGNVEGAACAVTNMFIKDMDDDLNIKICLSRHFESCCVYYAVLQATALSSAPVEMEGPLEMHPAL